jgi:hypothetical protein
MYTGILVNHQPSELDRKIKNRYIRLGLTILFSNQPECVCFYKNKSSFVKTDIYDMEKQQSITLKRFSTLLFVVIAHMDDFQDYNLN